MPPVDGNKLSSALKQTLDPSTLKELYFHDNTTRRTRLKNANIEIPTNTLPEELDQVLTSNLSAAELERLEEQIVSSHVNNAVDAVVGATSDGGPSKRPVEP